MKGNVFIITYFYWQDGNRKQHSFAIYWEEEWTIQELKSIADEEVEDNKDIDGYYITKQEILASNI